MSGTGSFDAAFTFYSKTLNSFAPKIFTKGFLASPCCSLGTFLAPFSPLFSGQVPLLATDSKNDLLLSKFLEVPIWLRLYLEGLADLPLWSVLCLQILYFLSVVIGISLYVSMPIDAIRECYLSIFVSRFLTIFFLSISYLRKSSLLWMMWSRPSLTSFSSSFSGNQYRKYLFFLFIVLVMQLQQRARSHLFCVSRQSNRMQRYQLGSDLSLTMETAMKMQGCVKQSTFSTQYSLTSLMRFYSSSLSQMRIQLTFSTTRHSLKVSIIMSTLFLLILSRTMDTCSISRKSWHTVQAQTFSSLASSFSISSLSLSLACSSWLISCSLSLLYCFRQMLNCVTQDFLSLMSGSSYLCLACRMCLASSMILLIALFLFRILRWWLYPSNSFSSSSRSSFFLGAALVASLQMLVRFYKQGQSQALGSTCLYCVPLKASLLELMQLRNPMASFRVTNYLDIARDCLYNDLNGTNKRKCIIRMSWISRK